MSRHLPPPVPPLDGPPGDYDPSRYHSPDPADAPDLDLNRVWGALKRRRWAIALGVVLAVALAAVLTFLSAPVWYASTLIRVDEKEGGLIAPSGLEALTDLAGGGGEIETEMRMLRTRPTAERVVDALDLQLTVTDPRDVPRELFFESLDMTRESIEGRYRIRPIGARRYRITSAGGDTPPLSREFTAGEVVEIPGGSFVLADLVERRDRDGDPVPRGLDIETLLFQEAVEDLFDEMAVTRPDREANVIRVGYRTTDRALAPEVPNAMAEAFIARRIEAKKGDARSTVAFLQDQVEDTRSRLEGVEDQLRVFREGEQIVALGAQAEAGVQRLAGLQEQRTNLETERAALDELLTDIDAEEGDPDYRRLASFPTFFRNDAISGILQELIAADRQRAELLVRVTPSHPDMVAVEERIDRLEGQLASIGRNYLSALETQIAALDGILARFDDELERIPAREVRFARLTRQATLLSDLFTLLSTRLKEAEVAEAIDDSSVRVVEYAIEPLEPESPQPVRNLALAAVLGLLLGVMIAVMRELMDPRLQPSDRIEELYGLSTMARIPELPRRNGRAGRTAALVTLEDARSPAAESFRTLRTNVGHARRGPGLRRLLLTSPEPEPSKSATAANLAVALAQRGLETVLVDADLRRPSQHVQFDVPLSPGLAECLSAGTIFEGALRPTVVERLQVLPAGEAPRSPGELLDSPAMSGLLDALMEGDRVVVVDAPPVLAVADAAMLAPRTDGVILVVAEGSTEKEAIAQALERLRRVGATVLGVVIADASPDAVYDDYARPGPTAPESGGLQRLLRRAPGSSS